MHALRIAMLIEAIHCGVGARRAAVPARQYVAGSGGDGGAAPH